MTRLRAELGNKIQKTKSLSISVVIGTITIMEKRNPAYGCWSEEETNWPEKDTALINSILKENNQTIPTSLKEIKAMHYSLPY